jgi:small membrane protein
MYQERGRWGACYSAIMIWAQPILVALLAALVVLYFARLRSRATDGFLIAVCFGFAALLVVRPNVATKLAHLVGIGRGVDLVIYLSIPGLALMILLLFARTRDLNAKLTAALRENALASAQLPPQAPSSNEPVIR